MNKNKVALACLLLALGVPSQAALAAPAPAAADPAQDRARIEDAVGWMARVFAVPATPDIDASLRDAMTSLATEHLARLRKLIPAWIGQERARAGGALDNAGLNRAIHNRLVNEISLWRIDSPGPAYDAVYLRALLKPGVCDLPPRDSYLGVLMTWFQAVPAADRATLLAGERALLGRWGLPRVALPPRPAQALSVDEDTTITRLRSGDVVADAPMPPVLADAVFKGNLPPANDDIACALHQWGLAQALKRGVEPGVALAAWRYQTMRTATNWESEAPASAAARGPAAYPWVAQKDAVSGSIELRVTTDSQGHYVSAAIARRTLVVPGLGSDPPVAFETLFDAASLAQAPLQFKPITPRADGVAAEPTRMNINWTLK